MALLLADPDLEEALLRQRREAGADKYDEVWDGVYVLHACPGDEHQELVTRLSRIFCEVVEDGGLGKVRAGVNVASDAADWTADYRCPDVAVFLNSTAATRYDAFWLGGPDFAVEVVSRGDESRAKIGFYAKVGTRELLLVDRDPWRLELYRHDGVGMPLADSCDLAGGEIVSSVAPVRLSLQAGEVRPHLLVTESPSQRAWLA